jgi:hypothetical protein
MGKGVTKVVEVIAPIALNALLQAAEALIADDVQLVAASADDDGVGEQLYGDLTQFVNSSFANTYGYFYQGLRSEPPRAVPSAADQDIIVWQSNNNLGNIQAYLQTVFQDSIPPGDAIEVANNLSTLFADRFKEESLSWTPFNKRYNLSDGTIIDSYMVTSAARDAQNNLAGIAVYAFVSYKISG